MRVSTGTAIGAAITAMVALGACGGGGHHAASPPNRPRASATTAGPPTTPLAITTIPTLPPTTASTTTSAPPTTASTTTASTTTASTTSSTTAAATTTAPSTTAPPAGAPQCLTANLTASLGHGSGAAGTFYYDLIFHNAGASPCALYGFPGVSYVRGATGIQTGSPADHNPAISGQSSAKPVTLAAGGTAHAVLAEVDVGNYPPATCQPVAVRGLRVYPPNQTAALFVPQTTKGCQAAGVHQLGVGFVVP